MLFIIVLEALSREFRTGCPWELLYADDLVIMADTLPELKMKLSSWKEAMEKKRLRINMAKTKILISDHDLEAKSDPVKWPCSVCRKGVGKNSIYCMGCKHWVHKRCSGIKGRLVDNPSYRCSSCLRTNNVETHIPSKIVVCDEELEVVDSFRYLGDSIGQAGGCFDATTDRIRSAWKAFHSLLPVLTNSGIAFKVRGHAYMACVRSVLLYASETWALKTDDVHRIKRNDNMMIRWICSAKLADKIPMLNLRTRLGLHSIDDTLRYNRLRWYGHLKRMKIDNWSNKIMEYNIPGTYPRGRPKKRWLDNIKNDLSSLSLVEGKVVDRIEWRKAIRPSNVLQISPTLVDGETVT